LCWGFGLEGLLVLLRGISCQSLWPLINRRPN
jgi:hypothetical protein